MNRPKISKYELPKTLEEVPFPICDNGVLLDKNAGFRTSKPILDPEKCVKCMMCYLLCPEGTIYEDGGNLVIDYDFCKGCGICKQECKLTAIKMIPEGV